MRMISAATRPALTVERRSNPSARVAPQTPPQRPCPVARERPLRTAGHHRRSDCLVAELPAETMEAIEENIKDAIETYLDRLKTLGKPLPQPVTRKLEIAVA